MVNSKARSRFTIITMDEISMFNLSQGQNIGGYTLIKRLGGGAMGSVWRVSDDGGQEYAMKILRASMCNTEDNSDNDQDLARTRLRREAIALQRIHNSGVCSIVDMELDASIAFIVTELIDGLNLKEDVSENGPYISDDLERLAHKLIEAVKAVHAAGIIHRDIKPTNVMISATGPVLVDFGIAMGEGESHVTRTGLVMGTPGFIAPEIIEGGDSDEFTDWWSLAAVLAFAATGKPVFGTKPMMAVLERAASGNANLNGLPPLTMDALRSALNPDRNKRCTPDELEQAIAKDAEDPLAWQEAMHPFDLNNDADFAYKSDAPKTVIFSNDAQDLDTSQTVDILKTASVSHETVISGTTAIGNLNSTKNVRKSWQYTANAGETNTQETLSQVVLSQETQLQETQLQETQLQNAQLQDAQLEQTIIQPIQETLSQEAQETNAQETIQPTQEATQEAESGSESEADSQYQENLKQLTSSYMFRGTIFLLIFIPILLVITCLSLTTSLCLHVLLLLISATVGYNVSSHIHRQTINGTMRKDNFVRIFSIPWHFIKAIIYTIPSMLIILLTSILGAYIYPFLTQSNSQLIAFYINLPEWLSIKNLTILFPSYAPEILSPTSIGYTIGVLIGWIIIALLRKSAIIRLGLGAIFRSK